jgi:hypothetical protein
MAGKFERPRGNRAGGFMGRKVGRKIMLGLAIGALLGGVLGCGGKKTPPAKPVPQYSAEQYLTAIYGGSLKPVRDSLTWGFAETLPDHVLFEAAKELSKQLGAVKKVEQVSSKQVDENWGETVWQVTAEKKNYNMKIVKYSNGKVDDIKLQLSPNGRWVSICAIGIRAFSTKRVKDAAAKD